LSQIAVFGFTFFKGKVEPNRVFGFTFFKGKVEPNRVFGFTFFKGKVEPNPPLRKEGVLGGTSVPLIRRGS